MIPYTLRQLAYFAAAAEHGSIAEAARALNVSQPSVSAAIAKLEAQLGAQLFLRHHAQGVALTAAGRRLLLQARSLLAQAEELVQHIEPSGRGLAGELRVGCFGTFAPRYMPGIVVGFARRFPRVAVRVVEGYEANLLAALETGEAELAILYDVDLPAGLALRPLATFPPYALLPPGHRLAAGGPISLHDLAREPMILLDQPPSRDYFTSLFHQHGLRPNVRYLSPSLEMVRGLVANGYGYSVMVTRPRSELTYDGLRIATAPLAEPVEPGRIVAARLAQARPTRLAQVFLDHVAAQFAAAERAEARLGAAPPRPAPAGT